jgi:DnaJ family protein B protein 12
VQGGSDINVTVLIHLAVVLLIVSIAFIPARRSEYSLQKTYYFPISKVTQNQGVEYFVSKQDFDQRFPHGSQSRENLEQHVLKDYKSLLGRYCHVELQRREWAKDYPTPYCDRLRSLSEA